MMLVALGDKPARRAPHLGSQTATVQRAAQTPVQSAKAEVTPFAPANGRARTVQAERVQTSVSVQPGPTRTVQDSAQADATQGDADLASDLIASGVTTQSVDTVIAVLSAHRNGASINAAARTAGINYRPAQRIVEAAGEYRQRSLAVVS